MNRAGVWPFIVSIGLILVALRVMRWQDEDGWLLGGVLLVAVVFVVVRIWRARAERDR